MKNNKLISLEYQNWLPYTYMQINKMEGNISKPTEFKIREGSMPKIQNDKSRIIPFYKNISRF